MAGAFRDDLEAARARAEALAEENQAMRVELSQLRVRRAPTPATPEADSPREDPELATLAERTLERLDHLIEDHPLAAEADADPTDDDDDVLAEMATTLLHPTAPRAPGSRHRDEAVLQAAMFASADQVLERRLSLEREELQGVRRCAARMFWVGLILGGVGGALVATVLR